MTPEQLERFRRMLEEQQQEIQAIKETARLSTRPEDLDQAVIGRLSRIDAMQMQAMTLEQQRRRDIQLQRIRGALTRMQNGEYGLCVACEEEIALRRLETDPAAPLCIACASRQERQ